MNKILLNKICADLVCLTSEILTIQGIDKKNQSPEYGCDFSNSIFDLRSYYWGDCTCCALDSDLMDHKDTCQISLPNFCYKRATSKDENLTIDWYKYIGRKTEVDQEIDLREWNKIFEECLNSIKTTGYTIY